MIPSLIFLLYLLFQISCQDNKFFSLSFISSFYRSISFETFAEIIFIVQIIETLICHDISTRDMKKKRFQFCHMTLFLYNNSCQKCSKLNKEH